MSVDHYENFPVASVLCPPAIRPAVMAIYHFARTADDIADEGDASTVQRVAELADYRRDLVAVFDGSAASSRWQHVFEPLRRAVGVHALPFGLFADLLDAFEQDLVKTRYADRVELLDYCRRSANPVGRLLLHLHGVTDDSSLRRSDAICSALQLANFWQDLITDTRRGRLYVPIVDCTRCDVDPEALLARRDSPRVRALVADMVGWTSDLMATGAPLVHDLPGRAGWELRLVVQGGLRILEKIAATGYASLAVRPRIVAYDMPVLAWRALRMRRPAGRIASRSA